MKKTKKRISIENITEVYDELMYIMTTKEEIVKRHQRYLQSAIDNCKQAYKQTNRYSYHAANNSLYDAEHKLSWFKRNYLNG